jgi:hypothetical protein
MAGSHKASRGGPFILVTDTRLQDHEPELHHSRGRNQAKWRKASNPDGVPTFSCAGLVCTLETYKDKVKLTFAHGASLDDSSGLFNASLDAGARRAIDVHEGDVLDESAFVELVREAVALNRS